MIDAFLLPVLALIGSVHGPFQRPGQEDGSPALFAVSFGLAFLIIVRWFQ